MPSRIKSKAPSLLALYARTGGAFALPGGFNVTVRILNKAEAHKEMGSEILAQYSHDDHMIYLKKSRRVKDRKLDLEHELGHAALDWIDYFVRKAKVPQ